MSIEQQLERLNANLENLAGILVANTSILNVATPAGGAPQTSNAGAAGAAAASAENGKAGGRPRTVYYRLSNGQVVKSSSKDTPVEGAVEITKAEYEKGTNNGGTVPAGAPADPFGDNTAPDAASITMDQVREVALKYRDKVGQDEAKAHIAKYGTGSLKDLAPAKFAKFFADTTALLEGDDL